MNIYDLDIPNNNIEYANQLEVNRVISVRFKQDLSKYKIRCEITKADTRQSMHVCSYNQDTHVVSFILNPSCTEIAGKLKGQFVIYSDDSILKTSEFSLVIKASSISNQAEYDANEVQIQGMNAKIFDFIQNQNKAFDNFKSDSKKAIDLQNQKLDTEIKKQNQNIEAFKNEINQKQSNFENSMQKKYNDFKSGIETSFKEFTKSIIGNNLLINNDFQVNQRGKKEYTGKGYCLTMWYSDNLQITVLSDGWIQIRNTDVVPHLFSQPFNLKAIESYIACLNVRNLVGLSNLVIQNQTLDALQNGRNEIILNQKTSNQIGIQLAPNTVVELEYFDLFEGSYPLLHCKRKYAEDLSVCEKYLCVRGNDWNPATLDQTYTSTSQTNGRYEFPHELVSVPTIKIGETKQITEFGGADLTINEISLNATKKTFVEFTFKHQKTSQASLKYMYIGFEASCEPNIY